MKPKKNPKADLTRRSTLFTQIGLVIVLFLAWQAIEWKTYEDQNLDLGKVNVNALLEEDVPITKLKVTPPPPPPPPPPAPDVIQVVKNEAEVEEVVIESTETNQNEVVEVVEVQDVQQVAPVEEIQQVLFSVIENPPIYPGCEQYDTAKEQRDCMSAKVREFVNDNFDTDLAQQLGLPQGVQRINVRFMIDGKGNVVDVKAQAAHPRLKQEAIRVIESLPHMTPGKQRGKPVQVLYTLPILFQVQ